MKNLRLILTGVCGIAFVSMCLGQDLTKTGTTAAQFLKIGVGSRAIGMGGAFTATADDITAMYWNPGGLGNNYSNEAMFNHVKWFADINFDYAAFATHLSGFGTVGACVSVLSMDQMLVRTIDKPEGTGEYFNAGALAIGVSYARNLTDNFAIGFSGRYIREHIWNEAAAGFGFDIGTIYRIQILNEFRLAASICNFGTKMKLQGRDNVVITQVGAGGGNLVNTDIQMDEYDLPLLFRFGVAVDVLRDGDSRLTTAIDAVHPNDNTEAVNSGVEYSWNDIAFLRAGWKSIFERDTEQGITLGAGLNYSVLENIKVRIDYAYQDFGRLASVHYLSFGIKF